MAWLCREAGLPPTAAGFFTSGSAHSHELGLHLARDTFLHSRFQWSAQKWGLPAEAAGLRILCAEGGHDRVERAAAQLGLGTDAVVRVAVDDDRCLCPEALTAGLQRLQAQELQPIAIVASAGASASGAIDPLAEIAPIAHRWGSWLHVDAASAALLFSDRQRRKLHGIAEADSLGLDFCPLLGRPAPCSAFLVRDAASLDLLELRAAAFEDASCPEPGALTAAGSALLAPQRLDALKLWFCLQLLGRSKLAAIADDAMGRATPRPARPERRPEHESLVRD